MATATTIGHHIQETAIFTVTDTITQNLTSLRLPSKQKTSEVMCLWPVTTVLRMTPGVTMNHSDSATQVNFPAPGILEFHCFKLQPFYNDT